MTALPKSISAFIVTSPVNIFYLTGFKGVSPQERESILVLNPEANLIVPKLYQHEAKLLETKDLKVHVAAERDRMFKIIKKLLTGKKRVGFEENNLNYSEYRELKKLLTRSLLVPGSNFVENMRIKKSVDEIKNIEMAQIISQKAFDQLIKTIKTGQTEVEIAEKLGEIIKSLGGQGLSFETIVAVGQNSAKPHHLTGNKKLETGKSLLIDFGAKYNNYCADITRTIFTGKPKDEQLNTYDLVKTAQKKAIDAVTNGIKAHKVHGEAHNVFRAAKLHDNFLHGLGHGIGLEVHEAPHLRSTSEHILEENMVFSIEPGLYFPNWGGIRIEDLVTIKNGKVKVLGRLQDKVIILG